MANKKASAITGIVPNYFYITAVNLYFRQLISCAIIHLWQQ